MSVVDDQASVSPTDEIRAEVLGSRESHPVLDRLRGKLGDDLSTGDVISSYDRMHHRHSRS